MNELMIKEDVSSKIIEIRGVDVILDRDISATKCHDYIYDNIV